MGFGTRNSVLSLGWSGSQNFLSCCTNVGTVPEALCPSVQASWQFVKTLFHKLFGGIWQNLLVGGFSNKDELFWFWAQNNPLFGPFSHHRTLTDDGLNWFESVVCGSTILGKMWSKVKGHDRSKYGQEWQGHPLWLSTSSVQFGYL